jgi:outer membrane protein OmpA-like peptidoglycan-associated protein
VKSIQKQISVTVLFLLIALLLPGTSSAQSAPERNANQLYENLAFSKAVEKYEKLHKLDTQNPKYIQRLAYSYYKMLNYEKALGYYSLLVKTDLHKAEDYYDYAQLLRVVGKFDDSKSWLEKYIVNFPGDQRATKQLENLKYLMKLRENSENITIENLPENSRFTDMCPTFFENKIIYSSAKDSFSTVKNDFKWNSQPFLDLYESDAGAKPDLKNDKRLSGEINSRFHEGPLCFTADFKTMYFTRNNFLNGKVGRTSEGVNNLKIFTAESDGKTWKKIKPFKYNSDEYSVGHPAISPDNKTLYFISDMPGGYGETDIYKSEWLNGVWSKPLNMGGNINTRGKEMFPFVDKEGILYFASNGLPGFGGLDVFAARKEENGNYLIVNLGSPLNSQYDDFGYVINPDSLNGYFTSNRHGGKGDDDNYYYAVNKIDIEVLSYDNHTKELIPGALVALKTADGKVIDSRLADQDGSVIFSIKPREKYMLEVDKSNYMTEKKEVNIQGSPFDFNQKVAVYLKQAHPYLTIEVVDKGSGLIIPDALVDITEGNYDGSELEDSNGIVKMKLNDDTEYTFYVTAEEYFDKTVKYSSVGKAAGEYRLTIELEKIAAGKQFVLEDLYYDLNKSNIRADAAIVLDKLARILDENPEVRIEIGSHTDSRSSAEYNMKLSQDRSESVLEYLVHKGISRSRLVAKGYGETQLINKCADGVDCPEVDHQANRRTVIEILNQDIRKVRRGSKNVFYF